MKGLHNEGLFQYFTPFPFSSSCYFFVVFSLGFGEHTYLLKCFQLVRCVLRTIDDFVAIF